MIDEGRALAPSALEENRRHELEQLKRVQREARVPEHRLDAELSGQDNLPRRPILGIRA